MEQKNIELFSSLFRKSLLSYRRLKRLSQKERRLFTKRSDLTWDQLKVALAYKAMTKRSVISSIRWTKRHWSEYQKAVLRRLGGMPMVRRRLEQKFILKELLTQGFVPISQFKMKTKTGWYA